MQISFPHHREWFELFLGWWSYGFRSWLNRAEDDDSLTFTCELGPKEYAMTGPDGNELSDRWEESLLMKTRVEQAWREVTAGGVRGLIGGWNRAFFLQDRRRNAAGPWCRPSCSLPGAIRAPPG